MFCPQCKAAYRPGFTHCPDCDVDLVAELPKTPDGQNEPPGRGSFRSIWKGDDEGACVNICADLRQKGIPFRVTQHRYQYFKSVEIRLQIAVPPDSFGRAMEIVGKRQLDFTDDADDQRVMEIPAQDAQGGDDTIDEDQQRTPWRPTDATVEVFVEGGAESASLVESCLLENHISARIDVSKDGSRRLFVMPQDESRAREIVRELKDLSPQE